MLKTALVRLPSTNFDSGLTTAELGRPDYRLAIEQHQFYCAALQLCGLVLIRLAPDEKYPDSTFVEDTAVLTERGAILARPGAESRAGEVADIAGTLAQFYPELHSIRSPGTLDGGDVCEAGTHFFIGISQRTNESGARQLAELLESFGYTSSLVDIRGTTSILHLKSGIAYLGENRIVSVESLSKLSAFRDYEVVCVDAGEDYAANCIRVNDKVLVADGYPRFTEKLKGLDYQTIVLQMSEFQKMDGGLSCLSLRF